MKRRIVPVYMRKEKENDFFQKHHKLESCAVRMQWSRQTQQHFCDAFNKIHNLSLKYWETFHKPKRRHIFPNNQPETIKLLNVRNATKKCSQLD